MDVTPLVKAGAQIIQAYSESHFRVCGTQYDSAILVSVNNTQPWNIDNKSTVKQLTIDDFQTLISDKDNIDVVLLGTGATMAFPDPALKRALREHGLHVECMDTGAACRTYNVLMAEDRRVIAALLPV